MFPSAKNTLNFLMIYFEINITNNVCFWLLFLFDIYIFCITKHIICTSNGKKNKL
jgi:hypothetical protein